MLPYFSRLIAQSMAIFLLCISQSFAVNLIISTPQAGDVDLGSISSSTLNLNSGGVLNGNLSMGNSAQITTLNGGVLNGTINGAGRVVVAADTITNGNIGANSPISSLTINAGQSLNLANQNNSLTASGSLNIGSGATLIVGSGTVLASIGGASDGAGSVKFNANNTLAGSLGTGASSLSLVEIANGVTLTTNTRNIDSTLISIDNGGTLNYGSGTIVGEVEGKSSGVGNFIFNNTKTTAFTIGTINQLSNISIVNGATVTLGGNISADTINIGSGTSGKINSNGKNITANNIKIFNGATLDINSSSVIFGAINGDADGHGTVQFSGSTPINFASSLGSSTKLAQILISNETTLNVDNINLNADEITIGEGSSGGVGIPIINQNSGIIGADADSLIRLNSDSILNYNGGTLNGIVRGSSSNKGTFNINHDYINNSEIGQSFDLANLNISSGKTLTANADISANNISVAGNLDLGKSTKTITGNLITSGGSAIIDLGSSSHIITGNFSALSGDVLKLNALNNSNVGSLKISGSATFQSGIDLKISFNSDDGYLSDGARISIISASSGSVINSVLDSDIDVNNLGSNKSGLFTFKTESSGNNLFLIVDRKDAENLTQNKFAQTIYSAVDNAGSSATGELRNLQKLIDNPVTTDITRESALKSLLPQNNQDINNSSINSANASVNVATARLDNIIMGNNSSNNFSNFTNFKDDNSLLKDNISSLSKLNFEDQIFDDQALWIQGFSTSAEQENVRDADGYDYLNHGIAIGVDQEIADNLRLGISSSFSSANVKSNSAAVKQTNINSYQFNLYGGYNFEPYFVSGIVGIAINKYSAIRSMPQMGLSAKANYDGQTYIAKFESGMIQKLGSGFVAIPRLGLTAAKNQVATYSESGAGTLNLNVSNENNNFLEGRAGADLRYDNLEIFAIPNGIMVRPKIKLSYGYDFLGSDQSSKNNFQGQNNSFQIKNSNIDRASLKYGLGLDLYEEEGIYIAINYDIEKKSSYESQTSSLYLRYGF